MKNKIIVLILILIAIANFLILSMFSFFSAVFSTAIGLFFSFVWFLVYKKVLADKYSIEGNEREPSFKDYLFLIGPGIFYYLTVCGVAVSVYLYA